MFVIGGVSAENIDSTDVSEDISLGDVGGISDSAGSLKESNAPSASINVKVNYEYSNDVNKISPDFYVVSEGKYLNFTKTFDFNSKNWLININGVSDADYNITVMSAGYITQSKIVSGVELLNPITFDLKATDAYKLGMTVTEIADKKLDFKNADDVIVVSTAGVAKLNGKTSEDALEAILNYGNIAYSNVLMLRQSAVDPIDFAFITKKGDQLTAIVFENASTEYSYLGTISENMTPKQWNNYYDSIIGDNAWSFASLANGWAAGISREILQEAAFHGHICEGTLGGYSIIQALLKYYPPVQDTNPGGTGSPADITAFKVLGVPGGSDDDAAIFFLDDTIGKTGYVGMNTSSTGATENMIGFIRWYSNSATGDLIIMSFNSSDVKKLFQKETGINPDAGSLEELKYCSWWIKQINSNPGCLVEFLYEFTGLNETQYYYLMGTADEVSGIDGPIDAVEGHGLDMDYILSLNLANATRTPVDNNKKVFTDDELKQIGVDAANKAKEIFKNELGIEIGRDDVDFAVVTSASYVFLNGKETVIVRDGLYETLGTSLYSEDLLNLHQGVWKPLWFAFALRHPDTNEVHMAYLRYNPEDGSFFVGELDGANVVNVGIDTLNNATKLTQIQKTFVPDGNWFNIQTIVNAWDNHPLFDQMATFLYHAHVCPGVQPGFFITDYIQEKYPLGENESYTYIASTTFCKDDSMTYLLDLSPGLGNFYVQKLPSSEVKSEYVDGGTYQGVFVVWDDNLKIGKASILSFKWGDIDTSMYKTSEAKRATQIQAYIDLYAGTDNPNIKAAPVVSTDCEKWITEEQFDLLKQGSGDLNAISYVKGLEDLSKEDVLKSINDNKDSGNANGDSNGGTNSGKIQSNSTSKTNSQNSKSNPTNNPSQGSPNVGTSNTQLSSQSTATDEASEDSADDSASDSSAYEISKKPTTKEIDFNSIILAVAAVLILGGIFGYGYIKRK